MGTLCIALIIVLIIVVIYVGRRSPYNTFAVKADTGHHYMVHRSHENPKMAANLLSQLNRDGITLMTHLRNKYLVQGKGSKTAQDFVDQLLERYNFEAIIENSPFNVEGETSYSVDKGKELYICLRDKAKNADFHEYDDLLFVFLHELSHIGNKDFGHGLSFWTAFKFVLQEAVEVGIYRPVDYAKYPIEYCNGLVINHQPLFDASIPNL